MGTTLDALQQSGSSGVRLATVIAVEGYDRLLTDHDDGSAVETAWADTEWDKTTSNPALTGLMVHEGGSQSIEPWENEIEVSKLRFSVMNETFAQTVMRSNGGDETKIKEDLLCSTDDDSNSTIEIAHDPGFSLADYLHIGIETISYFGSLSDPLRLNTVVRGRFAPFAADTEDTNRFGRMHRLSDVGYSVQHQTKISDHPRLWHGKWVGVWLHRVVGGVLDTKSEAQLVWAGRISNIQDRGLGVIVVDAEDARSAVRDTVILRDQFRGVVQEGFYIGAGVEIDITQVVDGTPNTASTLEFVSGTPADHTEIAEGVYTIYELASAISTWLDGEVSASNLDGALTVLVSNDRFLIYSTVTTASQQTLHITTSRSILHIMGWAGHWDEKRALPKDGEATESVTDESTSVVLRPDDAPIETLPFIGAEPVGPTKVGELRLEHSQGTWFNNNEWLPETLQGDSGENWGVLQVGESLVVAKYSSDTKFVEVLPLDGLRAKMYSYAPSVEGARVGEGEQIRVKQVVMLQGSLKDILLRLFASTGESGYNHATYDDFAYGMGAAIPWELLGDNFVTTVEGLQAASESTMLAIVEKPTRLWELIGADLLLRNAYLVWRNQGLQFTSWSTVNSSLAEHVFTESNKAHPADTQDDDRAAVETHRDWLVNYAKIRYGRDVASGEYRQEVVYKDQSSIDDYGISKPVEIDARNHYDIDELGGSLDAVINTFLGGTLPMFSRPVRVVTRSIDHSLFEGVVPGDLGAITDDDVRDPEDGTMGISGEPCLVVKHEWDWGGLDSDGTLRAPTGRVQLAISEFGERSVIYSPAARIDTSHTIGPFAYGWDSSNKIIRTISHEYSESSEDTDAQNFEAGDEILIIEIDPNDPANPQSWNATIASVGSNQITINESLPGYDGSEREYRIVSRKYSTAQATQRTDAYQADDADQLIQDSRNPYEWGSPPFGQNSWTTWSDDDWPELHSTAQYGDGTPVSVSTHDALARMHNNLVHYKTATQLPVMWKGEQSGASGSGTWRLLRIMPFHVGPAILSNGKWRYYNPAILMKSSDGNDAKIRLWLSREPPSGFTSASGVEFTGPAVGLTYTRSSTSYGLETTDDDGIAKIPVIMYSSGITFITLEGTSNLRYYGLKEWSPSKFE